MKTKKRIVIFTVIVLLIILAVVAIVFIRQKNKDVVKYDVYEISTSKAIYSPATHTGHIELTIDNNHGGFTKLFLTMEDANKENEKAIPNEESNLLSKEMFQLKLYSGSGELPSKGYQISYKSHEQTIAVEFTSTEQEMKSVQFEIIDVGLGKSVLHFSKILEMDDTNICLANSQTTGYISLSATGVRLNGLDSLDTDADQGIPDAKILYADGSRAEFLSLWKEDWPMLRSVEDLAGTSEYAVLIENPDDIVRISTKQRVYDVSDVTEKTKMHELPAADNLNYIEDINAGFFQYQLGMSAENVATYLKKSGAEYMEIPSSNGDRIFRLTNGGRFLLRCSDTDGLYEVSGQSPVGDDSVSHNVTQEQAISNLKEVYGKAERDWETTNLQNYEFQYEDSYMTYSFMDGEIFSVVRSKEHYEPK